MRPLRVACASLLLGGNVEGKAHRLEGILVLRRWDCALALRVRRLRRDQHEERVGGALLLLDKADGGGFSHVGVIVAGAGAERLDQFVLVDRVIVIAGARAGEGVPEVPAGRHPILGITDIGTGKADIEIAAGPREQRTERALLAVTVQIFADQRGSIARLLEPNGERVLLFVLEAAPAPTVHGVVGFDAGVVGALTGEERGAAWS